MRLRNTLFGLVFLTVMFGHAQTSNENFVTEHTARIATTGSLSSNSNHTQVQRSTQYYDGLGRPKQQVVRKGSPTGYDLVSNVTHDAYGRQDKSYLPYMSSGTNGDYRSSWSSEVADYYSVGYHGYDNYPFSEKIFESSPLNRVSEEFGPGQRWRNNDNPVGYTYRPNTSGDAIAMFEVDNTTSQMIDYISNYGAEELWMTETSDEDGNTMREFTDKLGRVVCKKAEYSTNNFTSTYYIYDDFGNLTIVIPPQAAADASSNWEANLNDGGFRKKWLFRYRYDARHRMIEKQAPGAQPVYMIYDKRDRLVLTQDGNQRGGDVVEITSNETINQHVPNTNYLITSGSLTLQPGFTATGSFLATTDPSAFTGEWMFTKYDQLNRPVMTGIYNAGNLTRDDLQTLVDGFSDFSEEYTGTGSLEGYNNSGFPKVHGSGPEITGADLLTVNYYDNYAFQGHGHWGLSGSCPTTLPNALPLCSPKGQVTGSKVRELGGGLLESLTWYDDRYRVVKTITENHLGGTDVVTNEYYSAVSSLLTSMSRTHTANGQPSTTILETYDYDHMDRLTQTTHTINSQTTVTLHDNVYDETGRLVDKNIGKVGGSPYLQEISYRYNIRGWLSTINGGIFDSGNDFFALRLRYNDYQPEYNFYNGNIGYMSWKTLGGGQNSSVQEYKFSYDGLNRLKNAWYNSGGQNGYFDVSGPDSGIQYDLNGNIEFLTRKQDNVIVDDLDYDYSGNQLISVGDNGNNALFNEESSTGNQSIEYGYDPNGNMITDANKGISNITYNYLNLPASVTTPDGTIHYTYDATGIKLRKFYDRSTGSDETTDYVNGIHYKNANLSFIQHAEGQAVYNGSTFDYQYNLTDHLGNVRATVQAPEVLYDEDYTNNNPGPPFPGYFVTYTMFTGAPAGAELTFTIQAKNSSFSVFPNDASRIEILSGATVIFTRFVGNTSWETFNFNGPIPNSGNVSIRLTNLDTDNSTSYQNLDASLVSGAELVQRDDYYPFGGTFNSYSSGTENLYKLSGNEEQKEWSVFDFNARMYDPALGRFNSIDPLADVGQESWNPYHYNYNNPLSFVDPAGLGPQDPFEDEKDDEIEKMKERWRQEQYEQGGNGFAGSGSNGAARLNQATYGDAGGGVSAAYNEPWHYWFRDDRQGGQIAKSINEFNPLALFLNGTKGLVTGSEVDGSPISGADAGYKAVSAPLFVAGKTISLFRGATKFFNAVRGSTFYRAMGIAEYNALRSANGLTYMGGKELFVSSSKAYSAGYLSKPGYDVLVKFNMKPGALNYFNKVGVMHRTAAGSSGWAGRGSLLWKSEQGVMNLGIQSNTHMFNLWINNFKVIK